jgi:hypothetical protein
MKHIKRLIALVAVGVVGLVGLRTAEACGCHARDRAWAYCNLQSGYGIECTVVQYDHGCGSHWIESQVFTDGETAYAACIHH